MKRKKDHKVNNIKSPRLAEILVCVNSGAGPSDAAQPGFSEHGHQTERGLRETGLSPAAALVSSRHVRKPAAALLQTRGTHSWDFSHNTVFSRWSVLL